MTSFKDSLSFHYALCENLLNFKITLLGEKHETLLNLSPVNNSFIKKITKKNHLAIVTQVYSSYSNIFIELFFNLSYHKNTHKFL